MKIMTATQTMGGTAKPKTNTGEGMSDKERKPQHTRFGNQPDAKAINMAAAIAER